MSVYLDDKYLNKVSPFMVILSLTKNRTILRQAQDERAVKHTVFKSSTSAQKTDFNHSRKTGTTIRLNVS
jgi:uncharacterized membrane protein